MGLGFLMMLAFLFFAIKKKEEIGGKMQMNLKKNVVGSMIFDTNILTGSIQHRLSVKRLNDKMRKRARSSKKVRNKEKV